MKCSVSIPCDTPQKGNMGDEKLFVPLLVLPYLGGSEQ
jgi:hypothetical protein